VSRRRKTAYAAASALALIGTLLAGGVPASSANETATETAIASVADLFVDDAGTGDCRTSATPCSSIEAALRIASDDSVIEVAAGSYPQTTTLTINKSVTLLGANAGKAGYAVDRGPESIITITTPTASGATILITADNVVLDGFEITNANGTSGYLNGVVIAASGDTPGPSNVILRNNRIHSIGLTSPGAGQDFAAVLVQQSDGTRIERNYIYNLNCLKCRDVGGINTFANQNQSVQNLMIHENKFEDILNTGGGNGNPDTNALAAVAGTNAGSITFTSNEVINTKVGFNVNPDVVANATFTVTGNSFRQIIFAGVNLLKSPGVPITNNTFDDTPSGEVGFRSRGASVLIQAAVGDGKIELTNNSFSKDAIGIDSNADNVDARGNWWGSRSGPSVVPPKNFGDYVVGPKKNLVQSSPWIRAFTPDPNRAGEPGFWPINVETSSPKTLYVSPSGDDTTINGCSEEKPCKTIQYAIDQALADDTISVAAGTYEERGIYIWKPLTLLGPNADRAGNAERVAEAIIQFPENAAANSFNYLIYGDQDDITVAGFDLRYQDFLVTSNDNDFGVLVYTVPVNNLTIRNNRMYSSEIPIYVAPGNTAKNGLLIEGNFIDAGPFVNNFLNRGMYITNTAGTIQDNVLVNTNIGIQYMPYENPNPGLIQRNTVSSGLAGVYHNYQRKGAGPVTWAQNVVTIAPNDQSGLKNNIRNAWTTPVVFRGIEVLTFGSEGSGNPPEVTFTNNAVDSTFLDNEVYNSVVTRAVQFWDPYGTGTATLTNNSFVGWTNAVLNQFPATFDMEQNWWGTADETVISLGITNTGGGGIDFNPWIRKFTPDPAKEGQPGFWPIITETEATTPTPIGENVEDTFVGLPNGGQIALTFDQVDATGTTTVVAYNPSDPASFPRPPSGFRLGTSPVYYTITTTATFSGSFELCLSYDPAALTRPTVYHFTGGQWNARPTLYKDGPPQACATLTGFSQFALGVPDPTPPPAVPPSAPVNVSGTAGDGEVIVSWGAPVNAGSFPISTYQVQSTPASSGCVVQAPALSCTVTGLTNGTAYTFEVRALNGAGWGPYSAPSAAVTPKVPDPRVLPSITITGTRGEVRGRAGIVVTGATRGFEMGAILRPWFRFPGQARYTQGAARILVDESGGFTWQRRTGKKFYVSIRSSAGDVVSNRVIIPAR
jgi:hypothetical protein